MEYLICCVPVSPLRLEPSHRSEMVSQQVFGELCTRIEKGNEHWVRVRCCYDGYEGWCQEEQLIHVGEELYKCSTKLLASGWVNKLVIDDLEMHIPFGSSLPAFKNNAARWGNYRLHYEGEYAEPTATARDASFIKSIACKYLNTAYLWGGKSVFGIDCSGLSQSVYKFLDVALLRDAWQQAEQGEEIPELKDARCGDLAFFDNAAGKITHVGILLNCCKIIHASVKVRIDSIDERGITNVNSLERTHQLRVIKRYWP